MRPMPELAGAWLLTVLVGLSACQTDGAQGSPRGTLDGSEAAAEGDIQPEIFGLVGRVTRRASEPVPGGTVYLVPGGDVAELAETPIDLFASPAQTAALTIDEPIEDLIETRGDGYEQAEVGADGEYRFVTLPEGSHFVTWIPGPNDVRHLPGGDYCRVAFDSTELIGMRMDIRVSSKPSEAATYVGTSVCMECHGFDSTTRTAHNVGLQVPGVRSSLQDIRAWPDFDEGLEAFEAGTTLYYQDCDPMAEARRNCAVSESPAAGVVSFEVRLRRDRSLPQEAIGAYYVEIVNRQNAEPPQRHDVVLTYGGAVHRQQYLTRRSNENGSLSYFVLPLDYAYEGDVSNPDPEDWPWRDYRSELWYDFDRGLLAEPPNEASFDNNCAGCHFTGYQLQGSPETGWAASAVADRNGAFDYDGDGLLELINTGCEACHGPGSEHLAAVPDGGFIVSPGLITPGRAAMMCGSCHSRPLGIGGGMTGLPLSADALMPLPGIRRSEFALEHSSRVSGAREDFFQSGDSRSHYQQYSDHLGSRHYRNPVRLSSCTGCHDPHVNLEDRYAEDSSGNDDALCTVCHSPAVFPSLPEHVEQVTGFDHMGFESQFFCTQCHMVPTAKSGASVPALLDSVPSGATPFQYFWNDISAHRMTVTGREAYDEQPVAATNACAVCHGGFFPNP